MPCKPGDPGSIPSFSRTTFHCAYGCSHHKINRLIINPSGAVLVSTQGKAISSNGVNLNTSGNVERVLLIIEKLLKEV